MGREQLDFSRGLAARAPGSTKSADKTAMLRRLHRHKIDDDAFRNYLWVKVFDDNVSAIIKSYGIFHLSVF